MKIIIEADSLAELQSIIERFTAKPVEKTVTSISMLSLGYRSKNILMAEGIETVEQLMKLSDMELLKMPNLGRNSLNEIRNAITNMVKQ